MSSMQHCAAHLATSAFDGDAIAQYMRTDFITLPEHLSVYEARGSLSRSSPAMIFRPGLCGGRKEAARQFID